MADDKPIIIIKKKGGHAGHHGGAWKVAYADFVTAMMCFFMVMWLVNSAEVTTKQNIASYFRRPGLFQAGSGTPLMMGQSGILVDGFVPASPNDKKNRYAAGTLNVPTKKKSGTDEEVQDGIVTKKGEQSKGIIKGEEDTKGYGITAQEAADQKDLLTAPSKEQIAKLVGDSKEALASVQDLLESLGVIQLETTKDGMRIEIMDTEKVSMFSSGSARIGKEAEQALQAISQILNNQPSRIEISGHTDAKPFSTRFTSYTNWELSADRANAARRVLEKYGVDPARIVSVVGKADRELKDKQDSLAPANRRITLNVKFDGEIPEDVKKLVTEAADEVTFAPTATPTEEPVEELNAKANKDPDKQTEESEYLEIRDGRIIDPVLEAKRLEELEAKKDYIALPDEPPPVYNPSYIEKDKIFSDNPVLGPPLPFSAID